MKKMVGCITFVFLLLGAALLTAGCTDTSTTTTATVTPATTTAAATALYSAGDILKNPASSSTAGLLIIRYDTATDSYERAYIYPNADGSWGYRMDDKTTIVGRSIIEKVYTTKVGTVAVGSIPTGMPTTSTPVTVNTASPSTTGTPIKVTATTTTTATTTPTGLAPKITDIVPSKGAAGTTVSITALEGNNFVAGANVSLVKGTTKIPASNVLVTSPGVITCSIAIPSGTATGYWDVLITNPDKQYHQYKTAFYITEGSGSTTTTTTTTSVSATPTIDPTFGTTITSVSPSVGYIGSITQVTVTGSNLAYVTNIVLVGNNKRMYAMTWERSGTITSGVATFDLSGATGGSYSVQALSADGTILGTSSSELFRIP